LDKSAIAGSSLKILETFCCYCPHHTLFDASNFLEILAERLLTVVAILLSDLDLKVVRGVGFEPTNP
jgi:hypothetical protein